MEDVCEYLRKGPSTLNYQLYQWEMPHLLKFFAMFCWGEISVSVTCR